MYFHSLVYSREITGVYFLSCSKLKCTNLEHVFLITDDSECWNVYLGTVLQKALLLSCRVGRLIG